MTTSDAPQAQRSARSKRTLRVALVGGPMYDHLYALLDDEDVEIVVHEDHPTLNRRVADLLAAGERIDVLSTHSKYAPSQARWLHPLGGVIDVGSLAPKAVDLCTFRGEVLSVPRCIDVRVLWSRVADVPSSWDALAGSDVVFGFPGRESGLFGTFFEIVVSSGGRLFDDEARPVIASGEAVRAVEILCELARRAPDDLADWHYDQVDAALLDGRVDAAAAWPGAYGAIRDVGRDSGAPLEPHHYVGGISYAGVHSWAIPTTSADVNAAGALIAKLTDAHAARLDASAGTVPAHEKAFASVEPTDDIDAKRLAITRDTIANAMITYPALERFPDVEDAGWRSINAALRGEMTADDAVEATQREAERVLS
jgi:multiple sugar transport system substrate-binding protein